ncbi:hypothetical protein OG528_08300 [Streptomyces platensis]|uniref:hypothetical protein n=1 Tax=Streptomyces platensis TaxID=58346 RepID=UPI0030DEE594
MAGAPTLALLGGGFSKFGARDCEPSRLELFRRTVTDLRAFVLAQDIVYDGAVTEVARPARLLGAHDLA